MEKLTLNKIEKNEVLRYLGWHTSSPIGKELEGELENAICTTLSFITPRATHAYFSIDTLNSAGLLEGNDIISHLEGCSHAILFAITLGAAIEEKIRAAQTSSVFSPVVLDACATAAAETLCDKYFDIIRNLYGKKGLCLTSRFSPGYGDFAIEKQNLLLKLIDAPRKIGLYATQSSILTPRKSITAVIGVSDVPVEGKLAGCEHCALKEKCEYKRKGTSCNV